jgi:para-aminobenzoate synthetase component 1
MPPFSIGASQKRRYTRAMTVVETIRGIQPVDAFLALRSLPHCVWLDSAMREPRGRFSVVAADPVMVIRSKHNAVIWTGDGFEMIQRANPFASLADWLGRVHPLESSPRPFAAGALIGFFGYELKNHLERLPQTAADDVYLPEMWWGVYDRLVVFDSDRNESWLVSTGLNPRGKTDAALAQERAAKLRAILKDNQKKRAEIAVSTALGAALSNFTRERYLAAVQRAKDYIAAGDVYQINLSQRFECRATAPLDETAKTALYLRLRETNPAPFAAFLDIGDAAILSSSPECFLEINDRAARTFPIKGTRPRGATPAEDARLAEELRRSKKDNAELVMIVDLERNDLGRVCEFGTVHAPDIARIESYATVHHLVATVEGKLREGVSHLDCIRACFPGGSITGTPKIRAMEIIDELEPHARGVYTGAIGILGLPDANGHQQTMLNIAIRTMTVKGDRVLFHSGGGIVADSEPAAEYEETLHKARGMMAALR